MTSAWLLAGVLLGAAFIRFAAARGAARERRILATGLVVAALVYVVLALETGTAVRVGVELAGVVLFGSAAWLGARGAWWVLAAGWAGHTLWDGLLHLGGPAAGPEWYATLCLSFDLLVAARVVARFARAGRNVQRGGCYA